DAKMAALPEHKSRRTLPLVLGAVVLVALGWVGYRMFSAKPEAAQQASQRADAPATAAPTTAAVPTPVEPPPTKLAASDDTPINEVQPEVSQSALDSIRGTLRVSVRL